MRQIGKPKNDTHPNQPSNSELMRLSMSEKKWMTSAMMNARTHVEATMAALAAADYPALLQRGDALRAFIEASFAEAGVEVRASGYGSVFSLWFGPAAPGTYEEAERMADPGRSMALHLHLRAHGMLAMPSPYGRMYVSFAHDDEAFGLMRAAVAATAQAMR